MQIEPPYKAIWELISKGRVVPFLGAGASLSGRPSDASWDETQIGYLPTGRELANYLAEHVSFPSDDQHDRGNLAKVASYVLEALDRPYLLEKLHEIFDREYQVGKIHRFLADLEMPLLITTTNYDTLIEKAFNEKDKPFHLVQHPTDRKDLAGSVLWWQPGAAEPEVISPNQLPLSLDDTSIIYKIHGGVDRATKRWNSFVITEEDNVEFLARMTGQKAIPATFMQHYRYTYFLFMGYGLQDWNLRVMLKSLKSTMAHAGTEQALEQTGALAGGEDLRAWAIQYRPSVLEKSLWEQRRVKIYDMDIDDFVTRMDESRPGVEESQ